MGSEAPLPRLIGEPLSKVYGLVVRARNARYDQNRHIDTPDIPVISIGNLSVGGVGKTPMVQYIARFLRDHGHRPAILLRGYKAATGQMSDEEAEHLAALPDAAVIANPDRVGAARSLAQRDESARPTCILLDDGFQHRRLGRHLDLVLIDARRSPWRDRLLPAGWLREPPESLRRADEVMLTHVDLASEDDLHELRRRVTALCGRAPIAETRHTWAGFQVQTAEHRRLQHEPTSWLRGRRVAICCAIGEPDQFLTMVRGEGAHIIDAMILRDHAPFQSSAIAALIDRLQLDHGDSILCTAKDWPRLAPILPADMSVRIAYPVLSIEIVSGAERLHERLLQAAQTPATLGVTD